MKKDNKTYLVNTKMIAEEVIKRAKKAKMSLRKYCKQAGVIPQSTISHWHTDRTQRYMTKDELRKVTKWVHMTMKAVIITEPAKITKGQVKAKHVAVKHTKQAKATKTKETKHKVEKSKAKVVKETKVKANKAKTEEPKIKKPKETKASKPTKEVKAEPKQAPKQVTEQLNAVADNHLFKLSRRSVLNKVNTLIETIMRRLDKCVNIPVAYLQMNSSFSHNGDSLLVLTNTLNLTKIAQKRFETKQITFTAQVGVAGIAIKVDISNSKGKRLTDNQLALITLINHYISLTTHNGYLPFKPSDYQIVNIF